MTTEPSIDEMHRVATFLYRKAECDRDMTDHLEGNAWRQRYPAAKAARDRAKAVLDGITALQAAATA